MNKYQAIDAFFNSFDIPAYEENSIKKDAVMPYITYSLVTSELSETGVAMSCNVWYKSNSWTAINAKTEEISKKLQGGAKLKTDDGAVILYRGTPFSQNIPKDNADSTVKGKYINIIADYIIF